MSFVSPYFFMGVISSRYVNKLIIQNKLTYEKTNFIKITKGYNSRTITIENNSNSTIEITDIIVDFTNKYSCM